MSRVRTRASVLGLSLLLAACDGERGAPAASLEAATGASGSAAWTYRIAGNDDQQLEAVERGPANDVFVVGHALDDVWYRGVDVAPRPRADYSPFLARIDPDGRLVWIRHDANGRYGLVRALGANRAGDVAVAGLAQRPLDVGCGPTLASDSAGYTLWYASFDADGNCRAGRSFTVGLRPPEVTAATVLPDGGVAVAGTLRDAPIDLDGTVLALEPGSDESAGAPFVVVFDDDGAVRWAKTFLPFDSTAYAGSVADAGHDAAGRLYLTGELVQPIDVDGVALAPDGPDAERAAWVAVLEPDGALVRADAFGSSAGGTAIDVADDGSLALGGTFRHTVTFPGATLTTPSAAPDGFVVKLDAAGGARWAKRLWGTATYIYPRSVTIDVNGFVGVAAMFASGDVHVGDHVFSSEEPVFSAVIARLGSASGSTAWARAIIGDTDPYGSVQTIDMAATGNRRLVIAGELAGTLSFGERTLLANSADGFIQRLYP